MSTYIQFCGPLLETRKPWAMDLDKKDIKLFMLLDGEIDLSGLVEVHVHRPRYLIIKIKKNLRQNEVGYWMTSLQTVKSLLR